MKVSELVKILKKSGCELRMHGKEHDKWYSKVTNKTFMVPRHRGKEIPSGTLASILKDAGIK